MDIGKLDAELKAVCPVHGVSVGSTYDKATWLINFKPEATEQQMAAAQAVIIAFDATAARPARKTVEERLAALEKSVFG